MIEYEDNCVGCPREIGCLGSTCPFRNVQVIYCDNCGDYADYTYEDSDYCENCLSAVLDEEFSKLSVPEKLEALGIDAALRYEEE